jgi:hypothetical protein
MSTVEDMRRNPRAAGPCLKLFLTMWPAAGAGGRFTVSQSMSRQPNSGTPATWHPPRGCRSSGTQENASDAS